MAHVQEVKEKRTDERRAKASKGTEMTAKEKEAEAESLKTQGNDAFKRGDFILSHELYSKALQFASKPQKAVRSTFPQATTNR